MRVRPQGFALILVLVAVAALFSVAVFAGTMMRTTTVEVAASHHHDAAHREARSAAVLALAGLYTIDPQAALDGSGGAGGTGGSGGSGSDEPDPEDAIDLPEVIRDMLKQAGKLQELENKINEAKERQEAHAAAEGSGGLSGRVDGGITAEALKLGGLPSRPVLVTVHGTPFRITVRDAIGGLDLNRADEGTLVRFLLAHAIDERTARRITDQLLDWRDPDDFVRSDGAESTIYQRLGVVARNGMLRSPEELLYLPDMTRAIYERIRGDINLGGDGQVHVNSASPEVLMSLPGISRELADEIVARRRDQPFTDKTLESFLPIAARDALPLLRVRPSTYLALEIEELDEQGHARFTFDGVAAFTQRGLAGLGLRRH